MKRRIKLSVAESIAIAVSVAALLVSIWSVVESGHASRQAHWAAFHASTLATLERERATYSYITCLLRVTNTQVHLQELEDFRANLDNLEGSLGKLNGASEATWRKYEALLDGSRASFSKIDDLTRNFKSTLSSKELNRVASVCGNEG